MAQIGEEERQGQNEGDRRRLDHGRAAMVDALPDTYLANRDALTVRFARDAGVT